MKILVFFLSACALLLPSLACAEKITIAAAADMQYAMDDIVMRFKSAHPDAEIATVYGSSGNFATQIRNGAPFDLFFSADIGYPQQLVKEGFAASAVVPYGIGRIVLWRVGAGGERITLNALSDAKVMRIAIANPEHAPYGKRAREALIASGVWQQVQPKLVFGENIGQTAMFVQTGAADIGLIALSLALTPALSSRGSYALIPAGLHASLEQGFMITRRAAENGLAKQFASYMSSPTVRAVMVRYGFALPGE